MKTDYQPIDAFEALMREDIHGAEDISTDPDRRNDVPRRIVEVTIDDENFVPEFVVVDKIPLFKR